MARKPSKEATAREVFAHISLLDVARSLKTFAISALVIGIFSLIALGIGKVSSPLLPDWHVPVVVWVFITTTALLFTMLSENSYYEGMWWIWFPRLGCLGAILCGLYVAVGFWVCQQSSFWAAYLFVMPVFWFIELTQMGHSRLMTEREKS